MRWVFALTAMGLVAAAAPLAAAEQPNPWDNMNDAWGDAGDALIQAPQSLDEDFAWGGEQGQYWGAWSMNLAGEGAGNAQEQGTSWIPSCC